MDGRWYHLRDVAWKPVSLPRPSVQNYQPKVRWTCKSVGVFARSRSKRGLRPRFCWLSLHKNEWAHPKFAPSAGPIAGTRNWITSHRLLPGVRIPLLRSVLLRFLAHGEWNYSLTSRIPSSPVTAGVFQSFPAAPAPASWLCPRRRCPSRHYLSIQEIAILFRSCKLPPFPTTFSHTPRHDPGGRKRPLQEWAKMGAETR